MFKRFQEKIQGRGSIEKWIPSFPKDKYNKEQQQDLLRVILGVKNALNSVSEETLARAINCAINMEIERFPQNMPEDKQEEIANLQAIVAKLQKKEDSSTARESLLKYKLTCLPYMISSYNVISIETIINQVSCILNEVQYPLTYSMASALLVERYKDQPLIVKKYTILFSKGSEELLEMVEARLREDYAIENRPDVMAIGFSIDSYLTNPDRSIQNLQEVLNQLNREDSCRIM